MVHAYYLVQLFFVHFLITDMCGKCPSVLLDVKSETQNRHTWGNRCSRLPPLGITKEFEFVFNIVNFSCFSTEQQH